MVLPSPGSVLVTATRLGSCPLKGSVVRSVRLALPLFDREAGAAVLVVGSSSVERPIPNLLLSNVFRPAVWALCNHLASELAGDNVRVNMLSPGPFATEMVEGAARVREGFKELIAQGTWMKRIAEPAEIVGPVLYLASDASSFVTGDDLSVSGGMLK